MVRAQATGWARIPPGNARGTLAEPWADGMSTAMRAMVATILGLLGFVLYLGGALWLADHVLAWHWVLQSVFFVAAGIAWVWPARWLLIWGAGRG